MCVTQTECLTKIHFCRSCLLLVANIASTYNVNCYVQQQYGIRTTDVSHSNGDTAYSPFFRLVGQSRCPISNIVRSFAWHLYIIMLIFLSQSEEVWQSHNSGCLSIGVHLSIFVSQFSELMLTIFKQTLICGGFSYLSIRKNERNDSQNIESWTKRQSREQHYTGTLHVYIYIVHMMDGCICHGTSMGTQENTYEKVVFASSYRQSN